MKEPSPLPDDLLDYIAAERDAEVPAQAMRERMFARLALLIVLPPAGGGGGGHTGGSGPGAGTGGSGLGGATGAGSANAGALASAWKGKLLIAMLSAAVGAGAGAGAHARFASRRAEPVAATAPVSSIATPPPSVEATEAAVETAAPEAQPPASASARAEEHPKSAGSLRAERLLLEAATAALLRGDNASAIATLQRHARTFPKGELAQEREVLMVQALKASGDQGAAEQRAKDFKKKFPGSLQQETVDKASRPQ